MIGIGNQAAHTFRRNDPLELELRRPILEDFRTIEVVFLRLGKSRIVEHQLERGALLEPGLDRIFNVRGVELVHGRDDVPFRVSEELLQDLPGILWADVQDDLHRFLHRLKGEFLAGARVVVVGDRGD